MASLPSEIVFIHFKGCSVQKQRIVAETKTIWPFSAFLVPAVSYFVFFRF
jgi:hypothetical protein